jgi:hypothetical protein
VQFVEGNNFHVEWHLRFEVERVVKPWSTQHDTIHRCHEKCQVGMPFVHNLLAKTPKCLCKSCRRPADLQLLYSHLGALMLRNFEKTRLKNVKTKHSTIHQSSTLQSAARRTWHVCRRREPVPWAQHRHRGPHGCHTADAWESGGAPTAIPALSPCVTRHARMGRPHRPSLLTQWHRRRTHAHVATSSLH